MKSIQKRKRDEKENSETINYLREKAEKDLELKKEESNMKRMLLLAFASCYFLLSFMREERLRVSSQNQLCSNRINSLWQCCSNRKTFLWICWRN